MNYVNLGQSGLKVSRLALGCMSFGSPDWRGWVLDEDTSRPLIKKALDYGINFFDTADAYSLGRSEEIVGHSLKDYVARHRVVIASKLYYPISDDVNDRGLSRKHIFESVDSSLKRLGTDYIDLYQVHRFDPDTPLEETLDALDDVVRSGRVRYLGASSMYAWQFMKALGIQREHGWSRFISMQNHYNLLYREEEREMLPLCRSEGIGVIPWSPLARGLLARAWTPGQERTERSRSDEFTTRYYASPYDEIIIRAVETIANRLGRPMAQIAYAWLVSRPGVVAPIVGVSRIEHFTDAIAGLELQLSDEDVASLEGSYQPKDVVGHT